MTMDFTLANSGLIGNLKPGASIEFTFVERKPGEWVIVKLAGTGAARPRPMPATDPPRKRETLC
jgi:hypothetical protein